MNLNMHLGPTIFALAFECKLDKWTHKETQWS